MSHVITAVVVAAVLVSGRLAPGRAAAYSVLAHKANIDGLRDSAIAPMLRARFPKTSAEQILEARAYASGGCVIQDLGYCPFGRGFFSSLLHCVRTGDFIDALIRDALDANEYAFALGALGHYAADNDGHPIAVNGLCEFFSVQNETVVYGRAEIWSRFPPAPGCTRHNTGFEETR